jgi:hypothetical protein
MAHAGLTKSAKKKAKASKSVGSLSFGHGIEPFSAKSGKPSNNTTLLPSEYEASLYAC